MRLYYDFHLHSCLSPCGSEDMTPYNLVQMAALQGMDIIALTDHNTCLNCPAAMEVGREAGISVVPGMELSTSEEAHVVCLFPALENALAFDKLVYSRLPAIENRPDIFGEQWIMAAADRVPGSLDKLLINATDISLAEIVELLRAYDGFCFPAHIDKNAYSILASLGDFPPEFGFQAAEISINGNPEELAARYPILGHMPLLCSSDAHYLEHIRPAGPWIEASADSPEAVLDALRKGCPWSRA